MGEKSVCFLSLFGSADVFAGSVSERGKGVFDERCAFQQKMKKHREKERNWEGGEMQ